MSRRQRAKLRRMLTATAVLAAVWVGGFQPLVVSSEDRPAETPKDVRENGGSRGAEATLDRELPSAGSGSVKLRELLGEKATVLVFLSTECPISNGYVPTLNGLAKDYAPRGVKVAGLNANEGTSLRELAAHRNEFSISFPVLKDAGAFVATAFRVEHCPEVVLIDERGRVRYWGRIDDRYSKRGGAANEVQRHDLTIALDELLSGKPVSVERTNVVGCPIARRIRRQPSTLPNRSLLCYRIVARIVTVRVASVRSHCNRLNRPCCGRTTFVSSPPTARCRRGFRPMERATFTIAARCRMTRSH